MSFFGTLFCLGQLLMRSDLKSYTPVSNLYIVWDQSHNHQQHNDVKNYPSHSLSCLILLDIRLLIFFSNINERWCASWYHMEAITNESTDHTLGPSHYIASHGSDRSSPSTDRQEILAEHEEAGLVDTHPRTDAVLLQTLHETLELFTYERVDRVRSIRRAISTRTAQQIQPKRPVDELTKELIRFGTTRHQSWDAWLHQPRTMDKCAALGCNMRSAALAGDSLEGLFGWDSCVVICSILSTSSVSSVTSVPIHVDASSLARTSIQQPLSCTGRFVATDVRFVPKSLDIPKLSSPSFRLLAILVRILTPRLQVWTWLASRSIMIHSSWALKASVTPLTKSSHCLQSEAQTLRSQEVPN